MDKISKLEKSYLKQKQIFDASKATKVKNLKLQIEAVEKKIENQQKILLDLQSKLAYQEARGFETLETFLEKAKLMAKKSEETSQTSSS